MKIIGIIPSRFASTRLPGKPLVDINGKSMIQRVWESASSSNMLDKLIIALDDERVANECSKFNCDYIMTPADLPSGTDRIAWALKALHLNYDYIVNLQGDEPLLSGTIIDLMLEKFVKSQSDVGTIISRIKNPDDLQNPSIVKVVLGNRSNALYFSRSAVPFIRDYPITEWLNCSTFYKHIGIYAYKQESLNLFSALPQSALEKLEKLEQLRLLEAGKSYFCVETDAELIGVDTNDDLEKVRSYYNAIEQL